MSDDDTLPGGWTGTNLGVTLPDGQHALYDAGISPLYFSRSGGLAISDQMTLFRGREGSFWANNLKNHNVIAQYLIVTHDIIFPQYHNWRYHGFSLRCLVSTTNRLIIKRDGNLVSDELSDYEPWNNNGITMPDSNKATHNISFSPLFLARIGVYGAEPYISGRGNHMRTWAANIADGSSDGPRARWLEATLNVVLPSSRNLEFFGNSLRCLVSTKRQASE